MASRYWVPGGTGNWSSTTNWSATSGGVSGASVPTSADDTIVNALSGTSPTITVDTTSNCLNLDFTGAITPTFAGAALLNVYGSLTYISTMTLTYSGNMNLLGTGVHTINAAGNTLKGSVNIQGTGTFNIQSNLTFALNKSLMFDNGTLNTNNFNISCNDLGWGSTDNARTLNLGSSTITLAGSLTITALVTLNAGTSTIIMTAASAKNFAGGGKTYNNVTHSGSVGIAITITGSNTFNVLTVTPGRVLKLTSGTTQTITSPVCNGTLGSVNTLQSVTAGSPATIALPAGRYFIRHTSIKDITISGATTVTSIAGTNVSGNTDITFVTKFEMGRIKNDGSFNWYNTTTGTVDKVSG